MEFNIHGQIFNASFVKLNMKVLIIQNIFKFFLRLLF